ncbi:MAG TPA: hypothetical protein VM686_08700 [Polyangiaceae bacterium]|nr:hypothetical protein [Polyangiaceae bacterium]
MDTAFYRGFVASLTLVIAACSSPAEPAPSGPAPTGGSGGSAGTTSQGGSAGTGGVTTPTAGTGGTESTAGTAGTTAGGTAGSGGAGGSDQAGSAGTGGVPNNLPEGVPANYTLLLDEPFTTEAAVASLLQGNAGGWTFDAADGGALHFNGTGYAAPSDVQESLSSFAIISATKFSSFVLEVEFMQLNPDTQQPHRDICIVFNAVDEAQFLYAHIAQTHDDRSHNIHLIDHAPRVPITVTNNGGIMWGTEEWHKVRLTRDAVSGDIAVYWDDNLAAPILTANSTAFTEGYIGFGTFMDSGKIRNLKIWAETSANVPAENFFGG